MCSVPFLVPVSNVCVDTLPEVMNSEVTCSDGNSVGSVCEYKCHEGFTLEGSSATHCMKTPFGTRWSSETPICVPGEVISHFDPWSICQNSANSYKRSFLWLRFAVSSANAHKAIPLTIKFLTGPEVIACEGFLDEPENSDVICSDGSSVGSVCEFSCHLGFARVGSASSTCVVDPERGVRWSNEPPTCQQGKLDE